MSIESNDPRLSAYALNEMDDEARAAFEAELEGDSNADALRAELEEIRDLAHLLSHAHRVGSAGGEDQLAPSRRAEVLKLAAGASSRQAPSETRQTRTRLLWAALPLAAAGFGGLFLLSTAQGPEEDAASAAYIQAPDQAAANAPQATASPASPASRARVSQPMGALDKAGSGRQGEFESGLVGDRAMAPYEVIAPGQRPISENPMVDVARDNKSTFSIDVDTASYTMLRRSLNEQRPVSPESVRIEEMVNYFSYDYPPPDDAPFAAHLEVAAAPWAEGHRLVRVGLKGREVAVADRPSSNIVLLLDVSGSMNAPDKLPLVVKGLNMMLDQLDERDRVAIVVYAGASGVVLEPTSGDRKGEIQEALSRLSAGGSTNGGQGIQLAYQLAAQSFISGGTNRVILATDGDFNVGVASQGALIELIEQKAKTGVFLTVLGFGAGNVRDQTLEQIANRGNGHYAYIDGLDEARRVMAEQISATLITIAKDVKIQVTFDPAVVQSFRLIGYENRVMAHEDFDNDQKDAGEIGAGHTVTALYEIVPKSQAPSAQAMLDLSIRYKMPEDDRRRELNFALSDSGKSFAKASTDFRFAAAVAEFGLLLRNSEYKGSASYDQVLSIVEESRGDDGHGRRAEFGQLVRQARGR